MGYAATLSLLLLIYAGFVYLAVHERFLAEIDHRLDQEVEIAERSLTRGASGELLWRPLHEGTVDYQPLANVLWIDVHRADGTLVKLSLGGYARGATPEPLPFSPRQSGFSTIRMPSGIPLRVLQVEVDVAGERAVIRAAYAEDQIEHELASLFWVLALGLPLIVGIAVLAGHWLAGKVLAPVMRITEEARSISAARLDARLPVSNPHDELGQLAATFNDLFSRLERSFEQLRCFTADASHELRTPLTVIRSVGEVALRDRHEEAVYRDTIGAMLEEADRLTRLVEELLTLARADGGRLVLRREPIDLGELTADTVQQLHVLADEKGQRLDVSVQSLGIFGDRTVLRQALINIIDNAIKYSPEGATIGVRAGSNGGTAEVVIVDRGPGIAEEHRGRIFDRFYRIDPARSREAGGFGLGLAIALWAVEAHGGRIEVSSAPGHGSVFRIALPASANIDPVSGKPDVR